MGYQWPGKGDPKYRYLADPVLDRRGRRYILPQRDGVIEVWNLDTAEKVVVGGPQAGVVTALALSRDGATLVTDGADGRVLIWDVTAGEAGTPRLLASDRVGLGAELSPDGNKLALALESRLDVLDMASGAVLASVELDAVRAPARQQREMHFSPDGTALVTRNALSSTLVLCNLESRRVYPFSFIGKFVGTPVFSRDSSRLAVSVDRTLRVVNVDSGQMRSLTGHRDLVFEVAWSPDGKVLASPSYDRTIRLWDLDTGRVRILRGHFGRVESVAFSPDGATLTSVSSDGTVRRWDIAHLPDDRAKALPQRLAAATSAVIGTGGRSETPATGRGAGRASAR
jgi:WD40 repeat protein